MNILIADDETSNRKLLKAQFEMEGNNVLEAPDGMRALEILNIEKVDGIISDILMPSLDGYQFCAAVRRDPRFSAIPFLFYTATFNSAADERFAREIGADGFFEKPSKIADLMNALAAARSRRSTDWPRSAAAVADLPVVNTYTDLLLKKLAEKNRNLEERSEELRRSLERNRLAAAIVDSSEDAIISKSLDGTILSWNGGATRLYGYSCEEVINKSISILIPPDRKHEFQYLVQQALHALPPAGLETVRLRKDGTPVEVSVRVSPIRNEAGEILGISIIARDISAAGALQRKIHASETELRALAARLETVRENESTRIAREVHDELGQSLTALNMDLIWMQKKLTSIQGPWTRPILERVKSMSELVASTTLSVQRISAELRPSLLDHLGLTSALECQADEFQKRTGVLCQWTEKSELSGLEPRIANALFRIFQEIMTNISRHSGASVVTLALRSSDAIEIEVCDNGRGFVPESIDQTRALGLLGMRERALLVDAAIEIVSEIGKGTTVRVRAPGPGKNETPANPDR
jgi:PAS domain S-box-containing protein